MRGDALGVKERLRKAQVKAKILGEPFEVKYCLTSDAYRTEKLIGVFKGPMGSFELPLSDWKRTSWRRGRKYEFPVCV